MDITTPIPNPESRLGTPSLLGNYSGNPVRDRIRGVLLGFLQAYTIRDGWVDLITMRRAIREFESMLVAYKAGELPEIVAEEEA
jgi:hypothetical protein